jgi:hypothetical protein
MPFSFEFDAVCTSNFNGAGMPKEQHHTVGGQDRLETWFALWYPCH